MVGVMGDMADTMDGVGELFKQHTFWVELIRECEDQYQDQQLRDTAQWAKGKIQSSEQGPNLRLAIIDTGYIKKPNFFRL